MIRRSTDIPLERDAASRMLPWIVAVMVFVAALALAAAMILAEATDRWTRGMSGTLTVQVPVAGLDAKAAEARLERIADAIRVTPHVVALRLVPPEEAVALIRPWLGEDAGDLGDTLPRLFDVTLTAGAAPDLDELQTRLRKIAPGAGAEDHGRWMSDVRSLARIVWLICFAVVAVVLVAMVVTVMFAARTGLRIHGSVIELLHLMGARDSYVARQFARQALWLGFRGGFLGALAGAVTVGGLGLLARQVDALGLPPSILAPWQWAVIAVLPLLTALIARFTARWTVLHTLDRMA